MKIRLFRDNPSLWWGFQDLSGPFSDFENSHANAIKKLSLLHIKM
ncbi:hypothetical protein P872_14295 [Rhodonellum psychrophilum GCM71 = DSM 17998]|uniref:Uncharacterized protein n=1 Tax=Rhodonellum psychrophilum GCM71 = DSM 17998 TaxID=1123057 RepID=U5BRP0_9BACT|nr:hypothetical protein P872_14295 [Rhodonellum psychrophilum GCM71 = DSM 17998]